MVTTCRLAQLELRQARGAGPRAAGNRPQGSKWEWGTGGLELQPRAGVRRQGSGRARGWRGRGLKSQQGVGGWGQGFVAPGVWRGGQKAGLGSRVEGGRRVAPGAADPALTDLPDELDLDALVLQPLGS